MSGGIAGKAAAFFKQDYGKENMQGIEFTLTDGTKDSYDPITRPEDIEETETHYKLHLVYEYEIPKSTITSVRYYDLCEVCNHELYPDGCHNCI